MVTVKHNSKIHEFETLAQAMEWAKAIGEFVTIEFDGKQVVGIFGADSVLDGKLPNGETYRWKKRRRT